MAYAVTPDLVKGTKLHLDQKGAVVARVFHATGLNPDGSEIYLPVGREVPGYGAAHPTIPGLMVLSVDAEPFPADARGGFRYVVTYGSPDSQGGSGGMTVKVTGSNGQKKLRYDPANGQKWSVKYTDGNGDQWEDFVELDVLSPGAVIEFSYQQRSCPAALAVQYRRKTNSQPFQGGDPLTWLCRAFDVDSLNSGYLWQVRVAFEYEPAGWKRLETFRDAETGKVPPDVNPTPKVANDGNGWLVVNPYLSIDFSPLQLPDLSNFTPPLPYMPRP